MDDADRLNRRLEASGATFLPAVVATGTGIYRLLYDFQSNNGWILFVLGLASLAFAFALQSHLMGPVSRERRPHVGLFLVPYLLALYMFGVIGLMAVGMAIAESSGFWTIGIGVLWTAIGSWMLSGLARIRRLSSAA